jgi:hypothetical protein
VVLLLNYKVYEVHTLQHLPLHLFDSYAFEENRSPIGVVSTGTTTHVDEQCGCSLTPFP